MNNGPIYIADEPGKHDADAIRPLFVGGRDARVLRCFYPALPSLASLFSDARDVPSLLKICNLNVVKGVGPSWVCGLFNCQTEFQSDFVSVGEVQESVGWRCDFEEDDVWCIYVWGGRRAEKVGVDALLSVFLRPASFQILTICPFLSLDGVDVSCVGLVDKYNGTVVLTDVFVDSERIVVRAWARGLFGFYSSTLLRVFIDSVEVFPPLVDCLMLVDARIDGEEVLQSVEISLMK